MKHNCKTWVLPRKVYIFILIFMMFLVIPFTSFSNEYSYDIPHIKTPEDFIEIVFIDPENSNNGEGTENNPFNSFPSTLSENTAYLIKAGTKIDPKPISGENIYIGKYGEGEKPILDGGIRISGNYISLVDLHIQKSKYGSYDEIVHIDRDNTNHFTMAYCIIQGIPVDGEYPYYGIKGGGDNFTFYHNELFDTGNDGMFFHFGENYILVSNYIHRTNMGGLNSIKSTGDALQFEYDGYHNSYIANNYIDRSLTIWKFGLIFNATIDGTSNVVCEWNTIIGPKSGNGGSTVRWLGGANNKFKKNLLYTTSGVSSIESYNAHAHQTYPYGIRDNHLVGEGGVYRVTLDSSNKEFTTEANYQDYLNNNALQKYGSDIDPNNFWKSKNGVNQCKNLDISGSVVDDINDSSTGSIIISSEISDSYTYSWSNGKTTRDLVNIKSGVYTITIFDESNNCQWRKSFTVNNINDTSEEGERLHVIEVSASSHDENLPLYTTDNLLDTRWSAEGIGEWITFKIQDADTIKFLRIAWYRGDKRESYFDVQVSDDGNYWKDHRKDLKSCGTTSNFITLNIDDVKANYIRVIGKGNSENDWNSISEVQVYGKRKITYTSILDNASSKEGLVVFPNPVINHASIKINNGLFSENGRMILKIYNITGQVIFNEEILIGKNNKTIQMPENVALIPKGVYIIELSNDIKQIINGKFIKQ